MSPFIPFGLWVHVCQEVRLEVRLGLVSLGDPVFPEFPFCLEKRPLLPFGPGRQSVWYLAKNWFWSRLSSFLISICNSADVRFESCCETFRAERFCRLGLTFSPSENKRLANEVTWLTLHQHCRHQNFSPSYKHRFDHEIIPWLRHGTRGKEN